MIASFYLCIHGQPTNRNKNPNQYSLKNVFKCYFKRKIKFLNKNSFNSRRTLVRFSLLRVQLFFQILLPMEITPQTTECKILNTHDVLDRITTICAFKFLVELVGSRSALPCGELISYIYRQVYIYAYIQLQRYRVTLYPGPTPGNNSSERFSLLSTPFIPTISLPYATNANSYTPGISSQKR